MTDQDQTVIETSDLNLGVDNKRDLKDVVSGLYTQTIGCSPSDKFEVTGFEYSIDLTAAAAAYDDTILFEKSIDGLTDFDDVYVEVSKQSGFIGLPRGGLEVKITLNVNINYKLVETEETAVATVSNEFTWQLTNGICVFADFTDVSESLGKVYITQGEDPVFASTVIDVKRPTYVIPGQDPSLNACPLTYVT